MWRAFSRSSNARVALVLKLPLTEGAAESLHLLLSPVAYFSDEQVYAELHAVIHNIKANRDFLRSVERGRVVGTAFYMLVLAALCLKHEGFTGLRRGDAVRFGRQHVRDGVGTIKIEKSGFTLAVSLPILPVLARTLAAGPCGDLTFIAGEKGQPLTKESFGNLFRDACRAAGVSGSAHGVRKIAATRAANAGATVAQLEAIFGWAGGTMASLYPRSADRRRRAGEAMHKLAAGSDERTSIPSPCLPVRATGRKAQ